MLAKLKPYLIKYLISLLIFLLIDALWIYFIVQPMYQGSIQNVMGETIMIFPAIIFYLIAIASLMYFTEGYKTSKASTNAFILGLTSYATYSLTNYSIIKGWTLQMVIGDILWGGVLMFLTYNISLKVIRLLRIEEGK